MTRLLPPFFTKRRVLLFGVLCAAVFVLTAELACSAAAAEGQKRSRKSRKGSAQQEQAADQSWGDPSGSWAPQGEIPPADDFGGEMGDGVDAPPPSSAAGDPGERPSDPGQWGAPGHPDSPENFGMDASDDFSPGGGGGGDFLQKYEAAAGDEAIELGADGQFITEDRVQLAGVFYKGEGSKDTIPVLLIHDKTGSADDLLDLAKQLAAEGMAVLVPDLRGHGESTVSWVYDFSKGGNRPAVRKKDDYFVDSFSEEDFEAMRQYDGLLWYQFLLALHNEEKLNLRRLVVVGFGFGSEIGGAWIVNDWQQTSAKRGRFAKCFVSISPNSDDIYTQIGALKGKPSLACLLMVGSLDKKSLDDAHEVQCRLGREKPTVAEEDRKVKLIAVKTEKESTELASLPAYGVFDAIKTFIDQTKEKTSPTLLKWSPIKIEQ
ncbi:MAG: hypothetical protein IIZ25_02465 [Thermoguttaceae bacterium]|nr:hypothetical protein [Thermoguttaceae bacterium]